MEINAGGWTPRVYRLAGAAMSMVGVLLVWLGGRMAADPIEASFGDAWFFIAAGVVAALVGGWWLIAAIVGVITQNSTDRQGAHRCRSCDQVMH